MRVRSLFSPYYFVKVVLGYRELVPHLHQVDSELFVRRWISGVRKQWIEWPRGFFKSTTFTIGTGIWIVCPVSEEDHRYALEKLVPEGVFTEEEWADRATLHDQDTTQLLAYETIGNAKKKLKEIRWHFEENVLFRHLFPEIAYSGSESPWNDECLKIRRVGYGQRIPEGTFEAIGVDGALQSRHYRVVWEDDLVGKQAVESETVMNSTIRWHGLLHGVFENAAEQIRFGVSNRWGYSDLNAFVRNNEPDFVFYTRRAWETDPETGEDAAIFPERYPLEKLFQIRDNGSMSRHDFSCQYLNDPVLPGEQEVDTSKLHTYVVEADGTMVCSCGTRVRPSQLFRYLHYDPYNAKGVRSNSCPAVLAVGTSADKHLFFLSYYLGKGGYDKVYDKLFQFNDVWRPILFTFEDVGHQNHCAFHIRQLERFPEHQQKHRKFPRIEAASTHGKAKELRIRDGFLPCINRLKVSCRKEHVTFVQMLETFPNKMMGHDYDLLDAAAQGSQYWRFPELEEDALQQKQDDESYLAQLGKPYSQMEVRS